MKCLSQGHTAQKGQRQDSGPALSGPQEAAPPARPAASCPALLFLLALLPPRGNRQAPRRTSLSFCFLFPTLGARAPGSGPQGPAVSPSVSQSLSVLICEAGTVAMPTLQSQGSIEGANSAPPSPTVSAQDTQPLHQPGCWEHLLPTGCPATLTPRPLTYPVSTYCIRSLPDTCRHWDHPHFTDEETEAQSLAQGQLRRSRGGTALNHIARLAPGLGQPRSGSP